MESLQSSFASMTTDETPLPAYFKEPFAKEIIKFAGKQRGIDADYAKLKAVLLNKYGSENEIKNHKETTIKHCIIKGIGTSAWEIYTTYKNLEHGLKGSPENEALKKKYKALDEKVKSYTRRLFNGIFNITIKEEFYEELMTEPIPIQEMPPEKQVELPPEDEVFMDNMRQRAFLLGLPMPVQLPIVLQTPPYNPTKDQQLANLLGEVIEHITDNTPFSKMTIQKTNGKTEFKNEIWRANVRGIEYAMCFE